MSRGFGLSAVTGLAVLLAALVALELWNDVGNATPDQQAVVSRAAREAEAAPAAAAAEADETNVVETILARPLFAPSRRPSAASADAEPVSAAEPSSDDLPRLAGIVITRSTKLAIFQPKEPAKPIVVSIGGEIAGRKIESIDPLEVVVLGPGGEQRLRPIPDSSLEHATAVALEPDVPNPNLSPPRRPGPVRPTFIRPGMRRPPGVFGPRRPQMPNSVRGRRMPGMPGVPGGPGFGAPNSSTLTRPAG